MKTKTVSEKSIREMYFLGALQRLVHAFRDEPLFPDSEKKEAYDYAVEVLAKLKG